ncbi:hypothetical protein DLE01_06905, partial [Streptomyces sp. FT05W]
PCAEGRAAPRRSRRTPPAPSPACPAGPAPPPEKSLGTPDAGAHSLALIVRAVHGVFVPTLENH